MIIAIWIVTLLLLGLWTLGAWGLAALAGLLAVDAAWVTKVEPWLVALPFAGWLETWFPDWLVVAKAAVQGGAAVFDWLGGAAPVLVWAAWGVGALLLLVLGGALSLLVALIRRKMPPAQPPQPPGVAAA